jgi:hypothetical protein
MQCGSNDNFVSFIDYDSGLRAAELPVLRMWYICNASAVRRGLRGEAIRNVARKKARAVQPDSANAGLKSFGGQRPRGDLEGIARP